MKVDFVRGIDMVSTFASLSCSRLFVRMSPKSPTAVLSEHFHSFGVEAVGVRSATICRFLGEPLRFLAVLNRDGGTLRTTDIGAFQDRAAKMLEAAGHHVTFKVVRGKDVVPALKDAAADDDADVVLAGGGDGTISAAAAALMDRGKALAVLPAGTMNLFARALGVPLSLDKAVAAFAEGEIRAVDLASANGRPFVHQFSVGMHARMVDLRSRMQFASRWGKMHASVKAAFATVMKPPSMAVELDLGDALLSTRTSGIGITNNLFGEGTLPYARDPAGGTLGVYVSVAQERHEMLRFFAKMALGRWKNNDQVVIHEAEKVTLRIVTKRFVKRCVIDGELAPLDRETVVKIHPAALDVLVPKAG